MAFKLIWSPSARLDLVLVQRESEFSCLKISYMP